MGNGKWEMGNGEWEGTDENERKHECIRSMLFLESSTYDEHQIGIQEPNTCKWEMGSGKREMGDGKWETGNGKREMGRRKCK